MNICYGYCTEDNMSSFICKSKDRQKVVVELMKGVDDLLSYKISDTIYRDGCTIFAVYYKVKGSSYTYNIHIHEETLLNINGTYHVLPRWGGDDVAVKLD